MKWDIVGILVLSCLIGCIPLCQCWGQPPYGGWELILLGLLCVISVFLHITILPYQGWEDLPVLVFFRLIPTGETHYVQAYTITTDVWVALFTCGLVIDALSVVSNYRGREQDTFSGKRTSAVRLDESFGRYLYLGLGVSAVLLSLWFIYVGKIEPFVFT